MATKRKRESEAREDVSTTEVKKRKKNCRVCIADFPQRLNSQLFHVTKRHPDRARGACILCSKLFEQKGAEVYNRGGKEEVSVEEGSEASLQYLSWMLNQ